MPWHIMETNPQKVYSPTCKANKPDLEAWPMRLWLEIAHALKPLCHFHLCPGQELQVHSEWALCRSVYWHEHAEMSNYTYLPIWASCQT